MGIAVDVRDVAALALGSRGATADELAALDEHGFVVVPALLSDDEVVAMRSEFERLVADDPRARTEELGCCRTRAANDNAAFATCWRHRVVLDAAARVLGDAFEVGHVGLRAPNPGYGVQAFHPDHGETPVPGLTVTWFLDEFTANNGATRVISGSHRAAIPPEVAGTKPPVADEVAVVGPAGSVLLRDARLYHAGGRNLQTSNRRSALVFYQHEIPDVPADGA